MLEKVQLLCKAKGITVPMLEETLKFGKGAIYKWKNSSPSVDKIEKVADYFQVSVDYLLDREIHTIAAHHDGESWTEEELEEIERFKEFVRMKRKEK